MALPSASRIFVSLVLLTFLSSFGFAFPRIKAQTGVNAIQTENALPGTTAWQITKPSYDGEIQGYTGQDSVNRGGQLDVYVSTIAPSFNLQVFRMGYYRDTGGTLKQEIDGIAGQHQPYYIDGKPYPSDCDNSGNCSTTTVSQKDSLGQETNLVEANWTKSVSIQIPTTWVSGVYLIKLTESEKGTQWHIPFVVRDDGTKSNLLFEMPFDTYQAYNYWGGASIYRTFRSGIPGNRATKVSYDRPYASYNGSGNFFLFEYSMVRFIEEKGYDVRYTTNRAVAMGLTNLQNAHGFLSAGHNEYTSQAERASIQSAIDHGVSVGYFGGDIMYWQTRYEADNRGVSARVLVCYKVALNPLTVAYVDPDTALGPLGVPEITDAWGASDVNYPEHLLIKTDYGNSVTSATYDDLVVMNPDSWVYAGTGLTKWEHVPGVVGWEVDTADGPSVNSPPANEKVTVLSWSPFRTQTNGRHEISSAVLTERTDNHAIIFTGASVVWPIGLSDFDSYLHRYQNFPVLPENSVLRRITANILDRMASSGQQSP